MRPDLDEIRRRDDYGTTLPEDIPALLAYVAALESERDRLRAAESLARRVTRDGPWVAALGRIACQWCHGAKFDGGHRAGCEYAAWEAVAALEGNNG